MSTSWCTIESDPGVFTELILELGVKGVQVEELYSLDQESLDRLKPVHGLIFLFKWDPSIKDDRQPVRDFDPTSLFFAKQVITNACATQAILAILLNLKGIDLGPELSEFKELTTCFDPDTRGLAISNREVIRKVHNSFSRPEPFLQKEGVATKNDELYHFISYVPVNGKLYELDGLRAGPLLLGDCTDENWLEVVRPHIEERITKYSTNEIRFNLMAMITNREQLFNEQLVALNTKLESVDGWLNNTGNTMDVEGDEMATKTPEELKEIKTTIENEISEVKRNIQSEKEKTNAWRVENQRRKHNYIPLIVNILTLLAQKGELVPLLQNAQEHPS